MMKTLCPRKHQQKGKLPSTHGVLCQCICTFDINWLLKYASRAPQAVFPVRLRQGHLAIQERTVRALHNSQVVLPTETKDQWSGIGNPMSSADGRWGYYHCYLYTNANKRLGSCFGLKWAINWRLDTMRIALWKFPSSASTKRTTGIRVAWRYVVSQFVNLGLHPPHTLTCWIIFLGRLSIVKKNYQIMSYPIQFWQVIGL